MYDKKCDLRRTYGNQKNKGGKKANAKINDDSDTEWFDQLEILVID